MYLPSFLVSTLFFTTSTLCVKSLSSSSYAVTILKGLNASPNFIVVSFAYITGTWFIEDILGFTFTILCTLVVLPLLSVALYNTLYSPARLVFTLLSTTNCISSSSSVTWTPALGSKLSPTFNVWFLTPEITGALLAITFKLTCILASFP